MVNGGLLLCKQKVAKRGGGPAVPLTGTAG